MGTMTKRYGNGGPVASCMPQEKCKSEQPTNSTKDRAEHFRKSSKAERATSKKAYMAGILQHERWHEWGENSVKITGSGTEAYKKWRATIKRKRTPHCLF